MGGRSRLSLRLRGRGRRRRRNLVRGLAALRLLLRDNPLDGGENLLHRRFVLRFRLAAHASPATRGPEGPGSTADRAVARPVLYHWIAGKRKFSVNHAARGNQIGREHV